ncbi:MAG: hypothetical protein M3P08_14365 [Thermoproteota archaeon]|nr:hypothetical protein [Thermoproteota archaeon]
MLLSVTALIMVLVILLINFYVNVISTASGDPLLGNPLKSSIGSNGTSHAIKSLVDKFGIKEIYPTKPDGGMEWFINMSSPLNDKMFSLSGGSEKTNSSLANAASSNGQIIKQPDGSYQVYGVRKTGKFDFSVRMNVNASDSAHWWKNVEMTGYAKVVSANLSDAALDWYARGANHISNSPCEGVALRGGIRVNGTVFWQKEIWHTGGYTDPRSNFTGANLTLGKWIGFKAIMYNINNESAVRMESYLDDKDNNDWRKVMYTVDSGGWYASTPNDVFYSANCGRSKDYIVTNAGPIATFRSDNLIWDFKDLSIREIQPPASH